MKIRVLILLVIFLVSTQLKSQPYREIGRKELLEIIGARNDTTFVVNFWATWCPPCVKEIGYFEEVHRQLRGDKLKVVLVSLDFPNQAEERVIPFLKQREISAPVFLMTDLKYNDWIDQVDPTWSGAIPATIIFNRDHRIFLEKELSREELFNRVKQIMN